MATAAPDVPMNLAKLGDIETALNTQLPVLLYVYNGESLRADVRTELDKAAKDYANRMRVVKVDCSSDPSLAQYFELGKHPVLISWMCGEVLARRSRPWGTDITGTVGELAKLIPPTAVMPAEPLPLVEKAPANDKPLTVTDATFEQDVLQSELPVVVDFWAAWCGPCKQIAPILEKLAKEFAGKVRVAKVDVDANQELSGYFRIMSIPTLMFVKGGKIVGQQVGALPEHVLRDVFNQLIALQVP
jgi:thioredoxin 1